MFLFVPQLCFPALPGLRFSRIVLREKNETILDVSAPLDYVFLVNVFTSLRSTRRFYFKVAFFVCSKETAEKKRRCEIVGKLARFSRYRKSRLHVFVTLSIRRRINREEKVVPYCGPGLPCVNVTVQWHVGNFHNRVRFTAYTNTAWIFLPVLRYTPTDTMNHDKRSIQKRFPNEENSIFVCDGFSVNFPSIFLA